ncbi:hypothetical protein SAMN04487949_2359 [Halogranum gelatinilyticum]|uniref:DUF8132 domain-containing protein n=1 Tax=Halogranum gelatinilyticum TaxID=660521 RepID=A0A1G9VFK4_9EURY|nr:hypothetical protein [Halogranum gelatinilyticum]SDM70886.1 hypothetical protein SAMN04487949_2359 [Halogranum gelatinilyticum]
MKIAAIPWMVLTAVGLGVTTTTGYLVVRGPFFGGAMLPPRLLLVATGVFIVGLVVLALGGSKLARVYTGF